jgi:pimeloyl-ACP methyl ester carboxylesterase
MQTVITRRGLGLLTAALALSGRVSAQPVPPFFKTADIGDGLKLTYVEQGTGAPVVFVHGSISDLGYWKDQVEAFSASRRAVTYSRRYNWPNQNPPRPGYSAVADAEDLARLIGTLRLEPAHVVGHSYGALTGLHLASSRPELVRTLTLAEPPAVPLLGHIQGDKAALGRAMLADIEARMVAPMREAFAKGETEKGVAVFVDYVFGDPKAWDHFSPEAKAETLRSAHEWEVMMTTGELFPPITPDQVRSIRAPTLILSGGKSYPFLGLIDEELTRLIPDNRRIVFPNAGHQMWLQEPAKCREATLALQDGHGLR